MKTTYLKATTQKSYYNKAVIITPDDNQDLQLLKSYNTIVCSYNTKTKDFKRYWGGYSKTTQNHINDFRLLYNLPKLSKKEWLSLPANKQPNNQPKEQYIIRGTNGFVNYSSKNNLIFDDYETAETYAISISNNFWYYWAELK